VTITQPPFTPRLCCDYGRGFSATNLWDMKRFHEVFEILQTVSGESALDAIPQTVSGESEVGLAAGPEAVRMRIDFPGHFHLSWSHYLAVLAKDRHAHLSWTYYRSLLGIDVESRSEKAKGEESGFGGPKALGGAGTAVLLASVGRLSSVPSESARARCSLHASFDNADRPSSARSAMFIVTTTPEYPAKLRRSGTRGGPQPTSGSVRSISKKCRSYGAFRIATIAAPPCKRCV
jgi:hypothetical protein